MTKTTDSPTSVAIIGAGIAGLTYANRLHAKGISCQVIEKSRGRGGRVNTRRISELKLDLGAQYFTARTPAFQNQVACWLEEGVIEPWNFEPHVLCPESRLPIPSPDNEIRYIGTQGLNGIAHSLSKGLPIKFSCRVAEVLHNPVKGFTLVDDVQQVIGHFTHLVTAIPAEQTKAMLPTSITYRDQIPNHLHSPCWAVAICSEKLDHSNIEGVFGDEKVRWISRQTRRQDNQHQDKDYWLVHFAPDWSNQYQNASKSWVAQQAMNWLHEKLSLKQQQSLHCHFWRYANLALDSLSTQNNDATEAREGIKAPSQFAKPLIDFQHQCASIGDWTQGGRVEGAFESAIKLLDSPFIN